MTAGRDEVVHNLHGIQAAIERACDRASRDPGSVLLVAAAKTQPVDAIRWVVEAGVTAVGENYVRELRDVRDAVPGARWHYIGALQTNSAHHVAALADVVETISGERATRRLGRRAAGARTHPRRPDRGGLHRLESGGVTRRRGSVSPTSSPGSRGSACGAS